MGGRLENAQVKMWYQVQSDILKKQKMKRSEMTSRSRYESGGRQAW